MRNANWTLIDEANLFTITLVDMHMSRVLRVHMVSVQLKTRVSTASISNVRNYMYFRLYAVSAQIKWKNAYKIAHKF